MDRHQQAASAHSTERFGRSIRAHVYRFPKVVVGTYFQHGEIKRAIFVPDFGEPVPQAGVRAPK